MATTARTKRIAKELVDLKSDPQANVVIEPVGDDLTHLTGTILGPPDTPYHGGKYKVDIQIPLEYPFRPPVMKFVTRVWHPNISSQTGAICLDTLATGWSPILTLKNACIMLQSLLASPEKNDPQDAQVAEMMNRDPIGFRTTANQWANVHAGAPLQDFSRELQGGSGGATNESLKKKAAAAREAKEREAKASLAEYRGYNKDLVDRFCAMGFDVHRVVAAFEYVGIDRNEGQDYELEEAYMGDITARLFGEP